MSADDLAKQIDQLTGDAIRSCLGMHEESDILKLPHHVLDLFARASQMARRMGGVNFSCGDVILALLLVNELHKAHEVRRADPAVPAKPRRGDELTDADWRALPIEVPLIVHYAGEQRDGRYLGKSGRRVNVVLDGDDKPFRQVSPEKVIVTRVAQEAPHG